MERKRWVITTNQNRYVGIPYLVGNGFYKSFLHDVPLWNKTRSFETEGEAKAYLDKYESSANVHNPTTNTYYIDKHSFREGEKLEGVTLVSI